MSGGTNLRPRKAELAALSDAELERMRTVCKAELDKVQAEIARLEAHTDVADYPPRRIMITLTHSALFIKQTGIVELGEPIGRPAGDASVN